MTIIAPKVDSSIFSYNPQTKTFVTEMSTLRKFGQIYHDACDIGFTMVSAKTRREATFYVSGTERVNGEITGWRLKPVSETVRKIPALADVKVRVYND